MPEPAVEPSISKDQIAELAAAISAGLGPALKEAFEPFSKAQGDILARLPGAKPDDKDSAGDPAKTFDDKLLGSFPYGRKIRALAMATLENGSKDPDAAAFAIKKAEGWPLAVREPTLKWLEFAKTTLTAGNAATAGDMVFPDYDPAWIELLRNNAVVRGLARTVPMPRGATSRRKQTGAGTATYQGEVATTSPSNQTVGRVNLSYKKLRALTVVSNDLIRFSGGEADRFVQEDLLQVSALREDQAFLVGNPPADAGSPKGIRYWTAAANVNASAGTSLANFQSDITTAIANVQKSNVMATPQNSYLVMSVSTYWTIYALATTTGDMIFASELAAGRLFGFPVRVTTQLEVGNSWIGANAGLIMFVHGPSLEIHDSMNRMVETFRGGAYYDADTAAVVSGISNDETVIVCTAEHDFFQVYDTAASIITGYAT